MRSDLAGIALLLLLAAACEDKTPTDTADFTDDDGDGYQAPDDCDDSDPAVNPGAVEVCDDEGVDEDCDGRAARCGPRGIVGLADADAILRGEADGDWAGYSLCTAGDMDGDGFSDFVVGAPRGGPELSHAGTSYLVMGPVSGELDPANAHAILVGDASLRSEAGYSLSGADDVDADGYPDLLLDAPGHSAAGNAAGAAYVAYGPMTGIISLVSEAALMVGEWGYDRAGIYVSIVGDVNGDGYADILVGSTGNGAGGEDAGAVYFVLGPVIGDWQLSEADGFLVGACPGAQTGLVSTAGDVNGDGLADFLVGAPNAKTDRIMSGAAYLYTWPPSGELPISSADAKLVGEADGDAAGGSVSTAGDVDADGYADILIGAWKHDGGGEYAGAAYLVLGAVSGVVSLSMADAVLLGGQEDENAGISVSTAGDVDADGHADILVGASANDETDVSAGAAYLVLGPMGGEMALFDADAMLVGEHRVDWAGSAVSTAGDVDADGYADILVGAYNQDGSGSGRGAAYLFYGGLGR